MTTVPQNTDDEDDLAFSLLAILIEDHCDIENRRIALNWIQDREDNYRVDGVEPRA